MATAAKTNIVTMKDGREVDFGSRGKLKKTVVFNGEDAERVATLSIDCINGDTHSVSIGSDHPLLFEMAAHGLSQKISDSITKAEAENDVSFGVTNQIDQINSGTWAQRSSEGMVRGFSDLLEALRRLKGFETNSAEHTGLKTKLAAASEDEFKLYRANNAVKAVLAEIVGEKAIARAAKLKEDGEGIEGLNI